MSAVNHEQRTAYHAAYRALKAGNPEPMRVYRERFRGCRVNKRQERPHRPKVAPLAATPVVSLRQAELRGSVEAVAAAILAAECPHYEQSGGWRLRCLLPDGHEGRCVYRGAS